MRKLLLVSLFLLSTLGCLFAEPTKAQSGTLPPNHALISSVLAAATAQASVQVVSDYFDTTSEENRKSFATPVNFTIPQGETWVFAIDWGDAVPTEANPLRIEGGYGTWWISGPWTGTVNSGLAVRIK